MAKYDVTYSCGHEGVVNIIGPVKDREWKRQNEESKMCPDCWQKQIEEERERKNREAAEKAEEMELPELNGSEKQIAWANTLRQELIDAFDKHFKSMDERYPDSSEKEKGMADFKKIEYFILETKTDARYYIDNRHDGLGRHIERVKDQALKPDEEKAEEQAEKELEQQIKAESTVYPETKGTNAIVDIHYNESEITAIIERNEEFRQLVKNLGFRWDNGKWRRKLHPTNGTPEDRVAELGNELLNAGFPIRIYDEEIRNNAINGNFEIEHKRWIHKLKNHDEFGIQWTDGTDIYREARSLPGSKWRNPFVAVRVERHREVQEFADLYGFKFSDPAKEAITKQKEIENQQSVKPAKIEKEQPKDGLQEILDSGDDILDDLRD